MSQELFTDIDMSPENTNREKNSELINIFYILAGDSVKQAESKAECALSLRRVLLYFQPALSGHLFS